MEEIVEVYKNIFFFFFEQLIVYLYSSSSISLCINIEDIFLHWVAIVTGPVLIKSFIPSFAIWIEFSSFNIYSKQVSKSVSF